MATKTTQREIALLIAQGLGYQQVGNLKAAKATYLDALKKNAENGEALNLLGCLLDAQGNTSQAIKLLVRAVKTNPHAHAYFYNLANMHLKQGNAKESIRCYREAIRIKPDYAVAHNNLGQALIQTGQRTEAKASFLNAISIQSNYADAHYNLGIELKIEGDLDGAIREFLSALQIQPRFTDAYGNLGGVYLQTHQLFQALTAYTKAIEIDPHNFRNHTNLGAALLRMGRQQEATISFQVALKLNPNDASTRSNLILVSSYTTADAKALQLLSEEWDRKHSQPLSKLIKSPANNGNAEKRLRIGLVSADFRHHAAAYWIEPMLSNLKHEDVEVYCYNSNLVVDSTTERCRSYADQWVDSAGMGDEALAERIRRDSIDILVDLSSHTEGNRLLVFARQPAPVQVSWFGFPISTGLTTIQYRITDTILDPPGQTENLYSEELVHLNRFLRSLPSRPNSTSRSCRPCISKQLHHICIVQQLSQNRPIHSRTMGRHSQQH
jgi:protein O-GlcNAc transferase